MKKYSLPVGKPRDLKVKDLYPVDSPNLTKVNKKWKNDKCEELKSKLKKISEKTDKFKADKQNTYIIEVGNVYQKLIYSTMRKMEVEFSVHNGYNIHALQFWEILKVYVDPIVTKIKNRKGHGCYNTMFALLDSVDEQAILCFNHFISSYELEWDWNASATSYRSDFRGKHITQYIRGADGDGNIDSVSNIKSFRLRLGQNRLSLYVAPLKHDLTFNVMFGSVLAAFSTLKGGGRTKGTVKNDILQEGILKGGTMILPFSIFSQNNDNQSILNRLNLLYLICMHFEDVHIVYPMVIDDRSNYGMTYLVAVGYKDVHVAILNYLMDWYDTRLENPKVNLNLGVIDDHIESTCMIYEKIIERQKTHIVRDSKLLKEYINSDLEKITMDMKPIYTKHAQKWLEKYPVEEINEIDVMIHKKLE